MSDESAGPREQGPPTWARDALEDTDDPSAGISAGACMWPFLPAGVRAVTRDAPVRIGQVAVYTRGGMFRAHRVVAVSEGGVLVRPDRPGAALEHVPNDQLRGIWVDGAGRRNAFLRPGTGRVVSRLSQAVSGPRAFDAMRALARRVNILPAPILRTGIFQGDPTELVRALSEVGIGPRVASLESLVAAFLSDGQPGARSGFVALARSLGRPVGAAMVGASRSGAPAEIAIALRRGYRRPDVAAALLDLIVDEASHRGFETLLVQAREGAPERGALQGAGFERVESEHRRIPATGERIGLFRRELSGD